jgi:hypothetical protein
MPNTIAARAENRAIRIPVGSCRNARPDLDRRCVKTHFRIARAVRCCHRSTSAGRTRLGLGPSCRRRSRREQRSRGPRSRMPALECCLCGFAREPSLASQATAPATAQPEGMLSSSSSFGSLVADLAPPVARLNARGDYACPSLIGRLRLESRYSRTREC